MSLSTAVSIALGKRMSGKRRDSPDRPVPVYVVFHGKQKRELLFFTTASKNFLFQRTAGISGLQLKSVYKVSNSVNNWHFLWISRLTDEESLVYARYKPVVWRCIDTLANLDKIFRLGKTFVSTQTVPVDIKNLIHRCPSGIPSAFW